MLFRAIHHGWHHPVLDPVMKVLSDPGPWKFPLLALGAGFFLRLGRRGAIAVITLALTVAASDQLSSKVLKPIFHRPRPSVALADTRPLFGARRSYAFPSSHAANFFAAAPIVWTVFPPAAVAYVGLAAAVSLSRIYVGDHYPSDVIGGAILGILLGLLGRIAFFRLDRSLPGRKDAEAPNGGP